MRRFGEHPFLRWAAGALAVALVAMAVTHVGPVRHWLAARGHTGGAACPFGYGGDPAAARDAARRAHAALRGELAAHERPALGFSLDRTTAADLARWELDHGASCETKRGGTLVQCTKVGDGIASAIPLTSVQFQLGATGTLTTIRAVRRSRDADQVAAAFVAVERDLTSRAGAPVARDGSPASEALASAVLRQATAEYRFTDYRAVVRATNMGDGFVLTEEYASLVD